MKTKCDHCGTDVTYSTIIVSEGFNGTKTGWYCPKCDVYCPKCNVEVTKQATEQEKNYIYVPVFPKIGGFVPTKDVIEKQFDVTSTEKKHLKSYKSIFRES